MIVIRMALMLMALIVIPVASHASGGATIDLPKPLSDADAARYRQIFDFQKDSNWAEADKIIRKLDSDLLLGRVLAQRYMHPVGWRSTYTELRSWLELYNDHPHAQRISWLASRRKPAGAIAAKPPKPDYLNGYGRVYGKEHYNTIPVSRIDRRSVSKTRSIAKNIRKRIRQGWPTGAKNLLTKTNLGYLTKLEEAILRADIAHGYFIFGKDGAAIAEAERAIALAADKVPQAYWTAGIAAWRAGDIDRSMKYLALLALDDDAPDAYVSRAAFWAARGALRKNDNAKAEIYLDVAAKRHGTFYGVLAAEALGRDVTVDFSLPELTEGYIAWLEARPGGRRAFALLQVGETYYASRELRYLWEEMHLGQRVQTMSLAAHTHMGGLAFRAADILREENGLVFYGGLYPLADFRLDDPLRVSHALLLGLMRQESGFNPRAKSWAKASGLMQLLPATAAFIARDRAYRNSKRHALHVPEINIRLGEDYLLYLLGKPLIRGDLLLALAAYNGGPGNLAKWMGKVNHGGDMLMLIESLPARETRFYVKNVLTAKWFYGKRLGREAPVLEAIAESVLDGNGDDNGHGADATKCEILRLSDPCPGDTPASLVKEGG